MKKKSKLRKTMVIIIAIIVLINLSALILVRDCIMPGFSGTDVEKIWSFTTFITVFGLLMYLIFKSFESQ